MSTPTINDIDLREERHAALNHSGCHRTCQECDREEVIEFNGYVAGLDEWYIEVGQFLETIQGSIGGYR